MTISLEPNKDVHCTSYNDYICNTESHEYNELHYTRLALKYLHVPWSMQFAMQFHTSPQSASLSEPIRTPAQVPRYDVN